MIIRYDTATGDVLGYSTVGQLPPAEYQQEGQSYLNWTGIEPSPRKAFRVVNDEVVAKPSVEVQAIDDAQRLVHIRSERDKLLLASDYVILPDAPYSEDTKQAYRVYRQALRDVPAQADIYNIVWPGKP